MNSKMSNEDSYLSSIKRLIIPFILINILAVLLGASAVNIINILSKGQISAQNGQAQESLTAVETLSLEPVIGNSSVGWKPDVTSELKPEVGSNFSDARTYLPMVHSPVFKEPITAEISAYPEPLLPRPDETTQFDKTVDLPEAAQTAGSIAKVAPNLAPTQSTNEFVLEMETAILENEELISDNPIHRQLILPTIQVATPIINIPIVEGNWDISRLDQDVGVLEGFSKHPDDTGALVMAAHATTQWPTAGPFANLRLMELGDPIIYKIGNTEYVYEISRFFFVDTTDVNILRKNGEDGIVLVTCGSYNYFTGEYGSRLVAYGNLLEKRTVSTGAEG